MSQCPVIANSAWFCRTVIGWWSDPLGHCIHSCAQGHESEHDAQEQQHKEGGGKGEGPVYPPEDVFFTRCKLLAGALGAHVSW
jgi:hypothetical protein